jgi:hypothetical protein
MARPLPLPATTSEVDWTVALVGSNGPNSASAPSYVAVAPYMFQGYQQISNATLTNSSPLPSIPASATGAVIQNNGTQPARYRVDGSTNAPTSTSGMVIPAGESVVVQYGNAALGTFRAIRGADGVTLDVEYFT